MKRITIILMTLLVLTSCNKTSSEEINNEEKNQVAHNQEKILVEKDTGSNISKEDEIIRNFGEKVKAFDYGKNVYSETPYYITVNKVLLESTNAEEINSFINTYNEENSFSPIKLDEMEINENMEVALLEYIIEADSEEDLNNLYKNLDSVFKVHYENEPEIKEAYKVPFFINKEVSDKKIVVKELLNVKKDTLDYSFKTSLRFDYENTKDVFFKNIW